MVPLKERYSCACFGSTHTKIATIQRLAWALCKDDTQIHEVFHIFHSLGSFFGGAVPHGIQDLSSQTRGQTHTPCSQSGLTTGSLGKSLTETLTNANVQFSRSVVSNSLRPHESQHARPPCPSPTPRVHSNSCPSSQ